MNSPSIDIQHFPKWLKVRVPLLSLKARRGRSGLDTEPQSLLRSVLEKARDGILPRAQELAGSASPQLSDY